VFNPMEPHEVILGVGRVLRQAAAADAAPSGYQRSQLLSAASVARHLAAEQRAARGLLAELEQGLGEMLAEADSVALAEARAAIAAASAAPQVGAALAELTDREVAALAAAEA
jgi:hypothetical protein